MYETVEAHYGTIALLCASKIDDSKDDSHPFHFPILVSCGSDCELKIWKVSNEPTKIVLLQLLTCVKLTSVPRDMEIIGSAIGLVMEGNIMMTCRYVELPG